MMRTYILQGLTVGIGIVILNSANGLRHVFTNFEHIAAFVIAKELLEPIKPIAEYLQGRLQEVYFGFKKVDEVKSNYKTMRENVDHTHDEIYSRVKKNSK